MVSLPQRLPQCERETKTVHEAESEGDHPPSFDLRADDVLDRHVDDRKRDEHFHEWWKPKRIGRYAKAEAMRVIECATVNEVTTSTSGRKRRNGMMRQRRKSR